MCRAPTALRGDTCTIRSIEGMGAKRLIVIIWCCLALKHRMWALRILAKCCARVMMRLDCGRAALHATYMYKHTTIGCVGAGRLPPTHNACRCWERAEQVYMADKSLPVMQQVVYADALTVRITIRARPCYAVHIMIAVHKCGPCILCWHQKGCLP